MGQNKFNYLTLSYEVDMEEVFINRLTPNVIIKIQQFSKCVYSFIVLDANNKIILSNSSLFYKS